MTILEEMERRYQATLDELDAAFQRNVDANFAPGMTIEESFRRENQALGELLDDKRRGPWDTSTFLTYRIL